MYFSKLITFSLTALSASAAVIKREPVHRRDLATFQTAFANIEAALTDFDTAINALQPTDDIPTAIALFAEKAAAFDSALLAGSAAINASTPVNVFEALGLVGLVNDLVAQADDAVNDLIAKEPIINSAGQDPRVVEELNIAKQAGYSFIGAAVTHVPSATAALAQSLASQVITIINRGIVAFGGTV